MKNQVAWRQVIATLGSGILGGPVLIYLWTVVLFGLGKANSFALWKYADIVALDGLLKGSFCAVFIVILRGRLIPSTISSVAVVTIIYKILRVSTGKTSLHGDIYWFMTGAIQATLICYMLSYLYTHLPRRKRDSTSPKLLNDSSQVYVLK